ncbi:MAG: hypothetical protein ACI81L_001866 [Verrucomicrobiales bacterium]|jgi:hypothetical protein
MSGTVRLQPRETLKGQAVTVDNRPRGRPPKYPPDEVRRRLIDAAIATLRILGVESGLDSVTLDGAIIDADVPRGMSYKIWRIGSETPQDAFRHATVLHILSIPATAGLPATREFTVKLIEDRHDEITSTNPVVRKALLLELIRVVGEYNHETLNSSENWKLYSALRTAAITRPHTDPAVLEALKAGEEYLIAEYSKLYGEVAKIVGMRLREEYTIEQFAAATYAVNEGLSGRLNRNYERLNIERRTGPDDSIQTWSLFSVAFEALINHFFEWAES